MTDDPRSDNEIIAEYNEKRKKSKKSVKKKTDYKPKRKKRKKRISQKIGYTHFLNKQMDRLLDQRLERKD